MKISNTNTLGAKSKGLPYPVTLNPELYLSRTNGKFNKSTNGTIYVNEWIDPYSGLKATQDTGDYRPELVDDGVKFDGVDDVLTVDVSYFTNKFYISAWINLSSITNEIIFGEEGAYKLDIRTSSTGKIRFLSNDDAGWGSSALELDNILTETNKWYNIGIYYNGSHKKIFVNGEERASRISTGNISISVLNIAGLIVADQFFNCKMNDIIAFYDSVPSELEIKNIYNSTKFKYDL
jgi:hypothetical protein